MAFFRKTPPTTSLAFDRLEHGSLSIEGCTIEGTTDDVVAVLLELLGRPSRLASVESLPVLAPGEPLPKV